MFVLKNVRYQSILTIDEITFEKGKINVLIGKSGGGKTTLLKLLNKTISPSSGEILYNNQSLDTLDSIMHRRSVIYLSQTPYMFSGTIRENLLKGLKFHSKTLASDQTLRETLKMVSLNKDLDDKVANLSGGEKQRLALGRIILLDGDVYLLDEPSSALDDGTEKILIDTITKFVRNNEKTLIMISHSKAIATQYGDAILEIENGRIKKGANA